jgi:cell division protein FtsB
VQEFLSSGWPLGLFLVSLVISLAAIAVGLLRRPPANASRQEPGFGSDSRHGEMAALRNEVDQLRARADKLQEEIESLRTPQPATPYSQAIQMALTGRDADSIASRCGISRGEAELIVALNKVKPG